MEGNKGWKGGREKGREGGKTGHNKSESSTWGGKIRGKEKERPSLQGRAVLAAPTCGQLCLTGTPELQAALEHREGQTAWLEGACVLTS